MNENVLRQLLGEMLESEFAEYDNPPKWQFSLKHRLAMKRILARYERNMQKLKEKSPDTAALIEQNKPCLSFKQRMLIVICIIILMTFLVGWVVVFVSRDFHGTVHKDSTQLIAVNLENCPLIIEYSYVLASVPEGFELIETNSSPIDVYTLYENSLTKHTITLRQWVKSSYAINYNTENHILEYVTINGQEGLCVDFSDDKHNSSLVVWDNGDYVIEVLADLDKDSIIDLSKINKL
ncbi:MAG: DUF4367 domain-containing protein [Oscillospiraceae bacterium]|nr:DUF4367 domain-containing protein [Oscillospiraceae bacterium]